MIGWPRDRITAIIDIQAQLETKLKGLGCHATQIDVSAMPQQLDEMLHMLGQETFVLARSAVGWPESVETDLFRGLRGR
jgi:LmbE family N-acetylglucosaminyl deacetylase